MVFRLMIREPDDYMAFWRVDVMASRNLMDDFVVFCTENFGVASDFVDWLSTNKNISTIRWWMVIETYLEPPWLEMYFRNQEDVTLIRLFFPDILND